MKDPLLSLAPSDLRALACAIASGRLSAPYHATSVQRLLNPGVASEVASSLQELAGLGVGTQALTKLLGLLAAGMADRPPLEDLTDLVTTGPLNSDAGSRDTSVVVRDLFHNATTSVVVVGYAVHQGQKVFQALAEGDSGSPPAKPQPAACARSTPSSQEGIFPEKQRMGSYIETPRRCRTDVCLENTRIGDCKQ